MDCHESFSGCFFDGKEYKNIVNLNILNSKIYTS